MKWKTCYGLTAALLFTWTAYGQVEIQLRVGQQPGWDPRAREGRCELRLWVDHTAELSMRGDRIFVRTLEGGRSYDEGSVCNHPLPYNSIRDLQIRQMAGRNRIALRHQPNRGNNFTAVFTINDDQGGGDHYAFEVMWRAEGDGPNIPAPFFDDVRACQDSVRQRFLGKNGRGSYIDFDGPANRQNQNREREVIQGRGSARNRSESRDVTYTCVIDTRSGQVRSGDYRYSGQGFRTNERNRLK